MTTYVGRVVMDDRRFTVCSDLPGLPPADDHPADDHPAEAGTGPESS
jgi:hypothetical protein